jgi:hypothetical protein
MFPVGGGYVVEISSPVWVIHKMNFVQIARNGIWFYLVVVVAIFGQLPQWKPRELSGFYEATCFL